MFFLQPKEIIDKIILRIKDYNYLADFYINISTLSEFLSIRSDYMYPLYSLNNDYDTSVKIEQFFFQ